MSVVFGVLALAVGPAAIELSLRSPEVTLIQAVGAIAAAGGLLALLTLILARRGRLESERTLSRPGAGLVRLGRILGTIAMCIAAAAGIALAFYAILQVFIA